MRYLKPELNKPVQENFLGNGAVYHGYAGFTDMYGESYSDELCELEVERAGDMRLPIARTFYNWYSYDFEKKEFDWEREDMQIFCRWCERLQKRGIDIALNAGWWNDSDITSVSLFGESPFKDAGSYEKSVEMFAKWISDSVNYLVKVKGFTNVKYLVLFTEPHGGGGYGSLESFKKWENASRAVHNQLVKDGLRDLVKLVGPNEATCGPSYMVKWAYDNCDDFLDIYSSHTYIWSPNNKDLNDVRTGKGAVNLGVAGTKVHQDVILKPNTDYEVSCYLKYKCEDIPSSSGYTIFGAFTYRDNKHTIDSGGDPTNRLTPYSVKMLDLSTMSSEYKKYSHKFNSGDNDKCLIGAFYDGKIKGATVFVDDFCLTEVGKDENLIIDPSFENPLDWFVLDCSTYFFGDTYQNWQVRTNAARRYIKNGKPFWWDEYNIQTLDSFTDPIHGTLYSMAALSLMNAGCQTSLAWTAFDQQWPKSTSSDYDHWENGDHRCGIMPKLTRSLTPYPSFYAFSLMIKYAGKEGTKVYNGGGENGLYCSVTVTPQGTKNIFVINENNEPLDFNIQLNENFAGTYHRHLYDPNKVECTPACKIIGIDKVLEVEDSFNDSIPAYGVAVYTTDVN